MSQKGMDAMAYGDDAGGDMGPADSEDSGSTEDLPPDFEAAAGEAFPDMSPEQMGALYRAIEACKGGGGGGDLALIMGGKPKGKS